MPARPDPAITPELRTWLAGAGLNLKASYRVDEVMRLLDCGRSTIYTMIDRGDLEPGWVQTRGFVIERVRAHDLWHAAEANEILTRLGRAQIDPWGA